MTRRISLDGSPFLLEDFEGLRSQKCVQRRRRKLKPADEVVPHFRRILVFDIREKTFRMQLDL